jgi:hypothetical protein
MPDGRVEAVSGMMGFSYPLDRSAESALVCDAPALIVPDRFP